MIFDDKLRNIFTNIDSLLLKLNDISDNNHAKVMIKVLNDLKYIYINNTLFINNAFNDNFRYIDYYNNLDVESSINYFSSNYDNDDKDFRINEFTLFCLIFNLQELFGLFTLKEFSDLEELLSLLDSDNFYNNISGFSEYLKESLEEELEIDNSLSFLNPDNKFSIYFTGYSLEDIKRLPKNKLVPLINKLDTPLASKLIIPNQESLGHLNDTYSFGAARIHFLRDYRIVYVRYLDVTAILGISFKSGKDSDYVRYDFIAKNKESFIREVEAFYNGDIPSDSDHYKVIDILEGALKKYNSR